MDYIRAFIVGGLICVVAQILELYLVRLAYMIK